VNIALDSSTNYASWRDLMEQALQRCALIEHITADAPSDDPGQIQMDSVVLNWMSNSISSELHQVVRERSCTAVQRTTSGSPLKTSFSTTVSNIPFTLTLPFVTLFRVTSWCRSTIANSRPWPTVLTT
jgi:hypothetical protein